MKLFIWIARLLVGVLFIFSGFIKANDALGFSYKLEEYFEKFSSIFTENGMIWLAYPMDWMAHFAFPLAVFIVVIEMVLGVLTLAGAFMNKVSKYLLGMIVFFTFLTFVSWYFDIVKTCGCFGEAIPLTPFQSFLKDLILLVLIVILYVFRKNLNSFFSPVGDKIAMWSSLFIGFIFTWYCYKHLPMLDFRAYAPGKHLLPQMEPEKGNPLTLYKLKHKELGVEVELADYPVDYQNWDYIGNRPETGKHEVYSIEIGSTGQKTKVLEVPELMIDWKVISKEMEEFIPDKEAKIQQLSAFDYRDGESNYLDEMLNDSSYYFWLVLRKLEDFGEFVSADDGLVFMPNSYGAGFQKKINELRKQAGQSQVAFYAMCSEGIPEKVEAFRHAMSASFPFYVCDDTELKTMIRSSPGLMLLKGDQVIAKWHQNDISKFEEIKNQYIKQ